MRILGGLVFAAVCAGSALLAGSAWGQQSLTSATVTGSRLQVLTSPATGPIQAKRRQRAVMTVDASSTGWTDTGLPVIAGDALTLKAAGAITMAGHALTPDGMTRGWRDMLRSFPVDAANAGALVGRIGDSAAAVPFVIGSSVTLSATHRGNLFLRINSSAESPASGTVRVEIHVTPAPSSTGAETVTPFAGLAEARLDALPRRVTDAVGRPGDATNFALLGTEQQVRDAFAAAGWTEVDANTQSALLHGLLNTLQHKPYLSVPMSTLYLFGRPQDLSFARATAISVATERHHLRCWQSGTTVNGLPLWIGAATHDIGLERDERNGQLTHRIAPEIDEERDFLRDSFLESGAARAAAYFLPANPITSANTATGGSFHSDGRLLLLQLR